MVTVLIKRTEIMVTVLIKTQKYDIFMRNAIMSAILINI